MLGKLIKYEWRATARIFLPFYGAIVLLALMNRMFLSFQPSEALKSVVNVMSGLAMFAYVSIIIATIVITFIVLIQRFYKNLLGDEGYLMHTLPVKPWMHITSKLLITMLWNILSGIIVAISIMIVVYNAGLMNEISQAAAELEELIQSIGFNRVTFLLEFGLAVFLQMTAQILQVYTAISIGNLFEKHRVAAALVAYLAISFALNTIFSVAVIIFEPLGIAAFIESLPNNVIVHLAFNSVNLANIVVAVVFFAVTNHILKRRLNLQ